MATKSPFYQIAPNGMNHEQLGELFSDRGLANYGMMNTNPNLYFREGDRAGAKSGMQQGFMKIDPAEYASGIYGDKAIQSGGDYFVRYPAWQRAMQQQYDQMHGGSFGRGLGDFISNYGPLVMGGIGAGLAAGAAGGLGGAVGAGEAAGGATGALEGVAGYVPTGLESSSIMAGSPYTATLGGVAPTAAAGGAATGAGGVLGSINGALGTSLTNTDLLKLGGGALQGLLGYAGAGQQSDALRDVANQNLGLGAPYRNLLQQSYGKNFDLLSQPGYGDAFDRIADIATRQYTASMGNPANTPAAQAEILNDVWNQGYLPALSNYRGQLGQFGGLGLNTSGQAQLMDASNAGAGLDALAYGLGTAIAPKSPLEDYIEQILKGRSSGVLSVGGNRVS